MEINAKKTNLNDNLGLIGISRVKTHGLAIGSKIKAVHEKLEVLKFKKIALQYFLTLKRQSYPPSKL